MLSEARLAAASDLLNVAKALLVWVATQSLRHRWSDGQLPADLAPQNAPQRETLIGSAFELCCLTWVELSGLEPLTSCMPCGSDQVGLRPAASNGEPPTCINALTPSGTV